MPVSAGTGQFLDNDSYEEVEVGPEVPETADFGVRISGDSMMPRCLDKQIVWIQKTDDLKKLRKEQRLKQADLAKAVGMYEKSISNIELKKIQPALKQLLALQHILKSLWKISSIWRKNILHSHINQGLIHSLKKGGPS